MIVWQSFHLGTTKDGFGEEYLFKAENEGCENVVQVVEYREHLTDDADFVWVIRNALNRMIEAVEQRGMS